MAASAELEAFFAKYDPAIVRTAKRALGKLRKLLPGAVELVYDNYNALVVAFAPNEMASHALVSIALYPQWVTLFFLHGAKLRDPSKRLEGSGKQVRGIRLVGAETLDEPAVKRLVAQAAAFEREKIDATAKRRMVIRAVSAKQRPRRPR